VSAAAPTRAVADALALLGIERLALAIHDASLPSAPEEDAGRGAPASDEAARLFAFARRLGFDAIQLGPQGETPASPYDATWFSRNVASLAWAPLARGDHGVRLLDARSLASLAAARPAGAASRVDHAAVYALQERTLDLAYAAFRRADARGRDLAARLAAFERRHAAWLEPYARGLAAADRARWVFGQLLAHEQHAQLRECARGLGLALLADLQIGASSRDLGAWPDAFLPTYRLGAPPSRTNPDGQPWGYPLLDPAACRRGACARALELFARRAAKLFDEYDGVRVDHPHGLVDPWVYRDDEPDPVRAVQRGARLFGAPASREHPDLARFAIATPADLNPDPRTQAWAEDWVVRLSAEQVERYAVLLDELVAVARAHGRGAGDVACEVLSTLPYPLARVLERHGLGRFRVTQKADPTDPRDVYRSENAAPEDWIMVGTHDTAPIWRLVHDWQRDGSAAPRARRLAERLAAAEPERASLADAMTRDARLLALAHLAELFASPARRVMIFFSDLFGIADVYNEPGTVSASNWSLRLPPTWRRDYAERVATGHAMNVPRALAIALRARGFGGSHAGLVARLDAESFAQPA
jgi:4-alpha-glucanotransferase